MSCYHLNKYQFVLLVKLTPPSVEFAPSTPPISKFWLFVLFTAKASVPIVEILLNEFEIKLKLEPELVDLKMPEDDAK